MSCISYRFCYQVANLYNNIDEDMIESQKPMMLDLALGFERLIKNPKAGQSVTLLNMMF